MQGMERWEATEGTPQGAVISPLLSNIYLHPLDELMAACGYRMVRHADDCGFRPKPAGYSDVKPARVPG